MEHPSCSIYFGKLVSQCIIWNQLHKFCSVRGRCYGTRFCPFVGWSGSDNHNGPLRTFQIALQRASKVWKNRFKKKKRVRANEIYVAVIRAEVSRALRRTFLTDGLWTATRIRLTIRGPVYDRKPPRVPRWDGVGSSYSIHKTFLSSIHNFGPVSRPRCIATGCLAHARSSYHAVCQTGIQFRFLWLRWVLKRLTFNSKSTLPINLRLENLFLKEY